MDLSVIIPVYNGEKTLPELYQRIRNALDGKFIYEILFIYDFGKGYSWNVIQELINSDPSIVRGFHLKHNYGQHNAILFGMTKAHGDFIVTIDEDLQHDPEYIQDLISEQKTGDFDVVYGKFEEPQHPKIRIKTSEMLRKLLILFVPGLYPYYSPYRLIKKEISGKVSGFKNSYPFIDGYIGWTTNKISNVLVKHFKRVDGESSYSYFKLLKHAVFIIVAYSKAKTWMLLSSLLFNLSAIGLYRFNHEWNNTLIGKATIIFFSVGITFLFVALLVEILHHTSFHRNTKPVELI